MKKFITILFIFCITQYKSQVILRGENLGKEKFNISVIVDNDTVSLKQNVRNNYSIMLEEEKEFTILFSTKENIKEIKIYTYHKRLWFNLDIDLSSSDNATLIYDPQKNNYIMITKMGSEIPIIKN